MKRPWQTDLRVRAAFLVLLAMLPTLGVLTYTYIGARREAARQAWEEAARLARVATVEHDLLIEQTRNLLFALAHEIRDRGPQTCTAFFADLRERYPGYANVGVIDPDGWVTCSGLPFIDRVYVGDRVYFQRAVATRQFAIGEYQTGRITGKPTVNFGYPLLDGQGRLQAVVFAALDLVWLNELAAQAQLPAGSTVTLFDHQGIILARDPDPQDWVGKSVAESALFALVRGSESGTVEAPGLDGVPRLYGFAALGRPTRFDTVLVVGIPKSVAFGPANSQFAHNLAVAGTAMLASLVLAWLAGTVLVAKPVGALASAIREIRSGNLSARTRLQATRGELGGLAQEFDSMAEVLEAQSRKRVEAEEALRHSERRFRALIEKSTDAIALVGAEGALLYASPAAERLLGYSFADRAGRSVLELVHPEDRPQAGDQLQRLIGTPGGEARTTLRLRRADGAWRWLEAVATNLLHEATIGGVVINYHDITERAEAHERITRQVQQLQALRAIDMAITGSLDLRLTLNVILDQITRELGVDAADVLLLTEQTLRFTLERGFRTQALRYTNLRLGQGHAGQAALERRIIHVPDLRETPGGFARSPMLPDEQFIAYYAAPLVAKGQVRGVLEVFHRAPLPPDAEWLDFFEALALQTAIAIDNALLFTDLQQSHTDLQVAYDATLEGWSRALDLRDKETEGHTQRVTELTLRLARQMGMSEEQLVHVRRGALLHDIGKMGIPDSILLKPGPLTEGEWKIMRMHPVYAHQLLSPIPYLRPALPIPYAHHERWDGAGYPRGLGGHDIPLEARIFAVVDVFDALTSDRPYRPAWPTGQVVQHIREQAGRQFDPDVAAAFLQLIAPAMAS